MKIIFKYSKVIINYTISVQYLMSFFQTFFINFLKFEVHKIQTNDLKNVSL